MSASDWATFLSAQRKTGKTAAEAGALWRVDHPTKRRQAVRPLAHKTTPERPAKRTATAHALDLANCRANVTMTTAGAVLSPANGQPAYMLPVADPAQKLPVGAVIKKLTDEDYVAEQLDHVRYVAPAHYATAEAAIADFVAHFHGA